MTNLVYDEKGVDFILEAIGCSVDNEGYVINAESKNRMVDYEGCIFKKDEIICIHKKCFYTREHQVDSDLRRKILRTKATVNAANKNK